MQSWGSYNTSTSKLLLLSFFFVYIMLYILIFIKMFILTQGYVY